MRWINTEITEIIETITDSKVLFPAGLGLIISTKLPIGEVTDVVLAITGVILAILSILNKVPDTYRKYRDIYRDIKKRKKSK